MCCFLRFVSNPYGCSLGRPYTYDPNLFFQRILGECMKCFAKLGKVLAVTAVVFTLVACAGPHGHHGGKGRTPHQVVQ